MQRDIKEGRTKPKMKSGMQHPVPLTNRGYKILQVQALSFFSFEKCSTHHINTK